MLIEDIGEAFFTGAGLLWKALWALIFGYLISASVQVLITRKQMSDALGERTPAKAGLAGVFGFISSSCSFAAIATSRTVRVKGTHPTNALAFLIASTNLVIELGIVLWLLLGWRFFVANFLLGLLMIVYTYVATRIWLPEGLAEDARRHAEEGMPDEEAEDGPDNQAMSVREKLLSQEGRRAIANSFFMEWKMVYREILFGFTIAGFITVFVPDSFWNAVFLHSEDQAASLPVVIENAVIAPVIAFFTFIGSMGNVPLAALLWSKNASFGGVMAFLGADLLAATVMWVQLKYFGWGYTAYMAGVLYVCMVLAGITVHYLFVAAGALPTARPAIEDQIAFALDYTLVLNLVFGAIGGAMLWYHFRGKRRESAGQNWSAESG